MLARDREQELRASAAVPSGRTDDLGRDLGAGQELPQLAHPSEVSLGDDGVSGGAHVLSIA